MAKKNKKTKKHPFLSFLISSLSCVILAAGACVLAFRISLSAPDSKMNAKEIHVEIPNGASIAKISEILAENGAIRSDRAFYLASRFPFLSLRNQIPLMKSGFYTLSSSMNALEIMGLLEKGEQGGIRTALPEGLTIRKIASILEKNEICPADDFVEAAYSTALLEKYAIPSHSFEGFLFPDTYFFMPGMSAEQILSVMVDTFFDKISEIPYFEGKSPSQFYDDLVLASVVEREYRVEDEAPLIASVFKNRVAVGMGLESCATIEYILTEIQGKPHPDIITYDDLKIDSPYNTYKWAALPPTPISNPGLVALNAVAASPETDYFYFTLTDSEEGSHTFSKSFNAHVRNTAQFRTKKSK